MNLRLRTANRVLVKIHSFEASNAEDLYRHAYDYPWEDVINVNTYFSIHSIVHNSTINDNRFANQKLKDAIVDRFVKSTRKRPNTGSDFEGAVFFLRWINEEVTLFLDTSGKPLSRRYYRKNPWKAPMNESLAAAVVMATSWDLKSPFVNPMCGSGTLSVEAAMIALNRPANFERENYSFMHTRYYHPTTWRMIRNKSQIEAKSKLPFPIIATDRDPGAIAATVENAKRAGMKRHIDTTVCDYTDTEMQGSGGVVIINPEYGERLGEQESLDEVYSGIGDFFKNKCFGNKGYIFTGNLSAAKKVGLKSSMKMPFYNGKIDCRLLEYDLYEGSLKDQFNGEGEIK